MFTDNANGTGLHAVIAYFLDEAHFRANAAGWLPLGNLLSVARHVPRQGYNAAIERNSNVLHTRSRDIATK